MARRFWILCLAICVAIGVSTLAAAPASAVGYYNLPGNFCQCFGYGNGGGYHACLVLGPPNCQGFCNEHEVRVPYPPRPACDCYGYGNFGCGCYGGDSYSEPQLAPPAEPQPQPSQAAMRPQILR